MIIPTRFSLLPGQNLIIRHNSGYKVRVDFNKQFKYTFSTASKKVSGSSTPFQEHTQLEPNCRLEHLLFQIVMPGSLKSQGTMLTQDQRIFSAWNFKYENEWRETYPMHWTAAWSGTQRVGFVSRSSTVSHVDDASEAAVDDPADAASSSLRCRTFPLPHLQFKDICLQSAIRVMRKSRCKASICSAKNKVHI